MPEALGHRGWCLSTFVVVLGCVGGIGRRQNSAFTLNNDLWITLGLLGQAIFTGRFVLQWLYSERMHRSVMPMGFWYASIIGGAMLLAFAVYKRDPVFIAGCLGGLLIYLRNLHLRIREAKANGGRGTR